MGSLRKRCLHSASKEEQEFPADPKCAPGGRDRCEKGSRQHGIRGLMRGGMQRKEGNRVPAGRTT